MGVQKSPGSLWCLWLQARDQPRRPARYVPCLFSCLQTIWFKPVSMQVSCHAGGEGNPLPEAHLCSQDSSRWVKSYPGKGNSCRRCGSMEVVTQRNKEALCVSGTDTKLSVWRTMYNIQPRTATSKITDQGRGLSVTQK